MKIQNSEGHIVEVPRHLRKKIKQMLDNNQHDEVTQMFAQGGIIPIPNPSGKQAVNRFKDGGKIPPYITNDPNDPRIEAYKDSSDKFTNSYNEFQKTRKEIKRDIGAFNYRADKYLSDSEKLAITGLQATHQRYSYKPQYEEKYYDNSELDKDIGNLSSRNKAKILGKSYLRDKSYTEAIGERVSDKSHFNSGRETNSPIGYYGIGDYRYDNSRRITRKDFDNHLKGKVNKDVENYYNETDDNSKLDHRTINIDNILKRRDGFPKNYKDKYSEPFNSYTIPRYAAPKQQVIYNGPKPQIKETITAKTVNKVKPVSRTKSKPKAKPIEPYYTDNPNDPRIKQYNDSLNNNKWSNKELKKMVGDSPIAVDLKKLPKEYVSNLNAVNNNQKPSKVFETATEGVPYYDAPRQKVILNKQQVTPESQTQINTGKEDTTKLGFRTDSTGKRHYRVNGKDVPDSVYKKYEALKHKKVEYGLGGTIGSLLQAAAPVAGLIPGVGTLVGAAAGVVGNGLQQLDSGQKWDPTQTIGAGIQGATGMKVPGKMAQGGMTGLVPVNIEGYDVNSISMAKAKKGELLVNNGNMIKNYISRPPHPERGQNPLGDDLVQPGSIVIPKNRSQEYLNAGRALRKQIEASVVSQQVAREGNMMRKGGQAGRSKMLPGGMAKDYFDREYPYAPSLNPHVGYAQVETGGNDYMLGDAYRNARAGLPASYNNMSPMTPLRTQRDDISNPYGQGTPEEGDDKPKMSPFDKMNLGQFGLNMIPAIGDVIDATASVQTPQFGSLRNVSPNLIDPNTGQSQINQAYRSGYNSLRDSGVYSLKSNRNLVADRMQRSGDQALNIANQNAQIKNQFVGMNTDINKYNLDMQNQVELYRMQGQAKRREARRNLLDRAPAAASQYMQNGLYAKMLGI